MELIRFTHNQTDIQKAKDLAHSRLSDNASGNRIYHVTRDLLGSVCCVAAAVAYNRFIKLPTPLAPSGLPLLLPHFFKMALLLTAAFQGILIAMALEELVAPKYIRTAHKTYKIWKKNSALLADIQKMYTLCEALSMAGEKISLDTTRCITYISGPSEKKQLASLNKYPLTAKEAILLETGTGNISFASYDRALEEILNMAE